MMTLRLGVDGSLTPWAQAAAGLKSTIAIKTKCFITMSPEPKRRGAGHRSFAVPWVTYRGTATSLPSLQTPWAAVPAGKLPVLRFRMAVGREAALWIASGFFVVTMLLLVVLAGSLTPCAKAGCAKRAETSKTAENARMIEHRDDKFAGILQVLAQKQVSWWASRHNSSASTFQISGERMLSGLLDRP
jgi:hypothetical protein